MEHLKFRTINSKIRFPGSDRISFDAVFFRNQEMWLVAADPPYHIARTMIIFDE